jgi:DNA-binding transcriptional LysR family regulator
MTPLNFRTLDLNLLRVFDEVMSERSLTRAAEKLAITQPAVSNAMRRLRDAMGDELLVRHGQGVQPTPAPRRCGPWCAKRWPAWPTTWRLNALTPPPPRPRWCW